MTAVSTSDMATLLYKLERSEIELVQVRKDMETFREEARLTKHQLTVTEQALEQSELKRKQLSERIAQMEEEIASYESLKQRSQTAVAGLQKVARESQDQVIKLETRLRQLLEQNDATNQAASVNSSENQRFMHQVARRIGLLKPNPDGSEVLEQLGQRLDKAALLEVQYAQSETQLNKALRDLQTMQSSTEQLTKRYEENVNDRKLLGEQVATCEAEKTDLKAQLQLLQTSVRSKDKQLLDVKKQLEQLKATTQSQADKDRKNVFELEMANMQLKLFVDSLAALLSTVDEPCPATDAAVKLAVQNLLDKLKTMKEAGDEFQQKVLQLQRQCESQVKSGVLAADELKAVRQRMRELESDKAQMESELLGLKMLSENNGQDQMKVHEFLKRLADRLGCALDGSEKSDTELIMTALDGLERLLSQGCLSQSCLDRNFHLGGNQLGTNPNDATNTHVHRHQHTSSPVRNVPIRLQQDIDSHVTTKCEHHSLPQLIGNVFRNHGNLDEEQRTMINHLCDKCAQALALALCGQIQTIQAKPIPVAHCTKQPTPNDSCDGPTQHLLARLQMDYENEHQKVCSLTHDLVQLEKTKETEINELRETVERLEKSRLIQAKKLDKVTQRTTKESVTVQRHLDALRAVKQLLAESQSAKARLSDYFGLLGRLVNVDTRFEPNPEFQVLQRVKQLVELVHSSGMMTFYPTNPISISPWTQGGSYPTATFPVNHLPALKAVDFDLKKSLPQLDQRASVEDVTEDGITSTTAVRKKPEVRSTTRSQSFSSGRVNSSVVGRLSKTSSAKPNLTTAGKTKSSIEQRSSSAKRDERIY